MRWRVRKWWAWLILIGWIGTAWVETIQLCYADVAQTPAAAQQTNVSNALNGALSREPDDEHCLKRPSQATDNDSGDLSPLAIAPTSPLWNDFVEQHARPSEAIGALIAASHIPPYFVAHRLRF